MRSPTPSASIKSSKQGDGLAEPRVNPAGRTATKDGRRRRSRTAGPVGTSPERISRPLSRLELLRGPAKGGHEGGVSLPESLPRLLLAAWQAGAGDFYGLARTGVGILPEDRLDAHGLGPPRLAVGTGFSLDLLDQARDPLPGRRRCLTFQEGRTSERAPSSVIDFA